MKNEGGTKGPIGPYDQPIPFVQAPHNGNYHRPDSTEEQIYCWYYYIDALLDPRTTGDVLAKIENLPEFRATWGKNWGVGDELYSRTHEDTTNYALKTKPL